MATEKRIFLWVGVESHIRSYVVHTGSSASSAPLLLIVWKHVAKLTVYMSDDSNVSFNIASLGVSKSSSYAACAFLRALGWSPMSISDPVILVRRLDLLLDLLFFTFFFFEIALSASELSIPATETISRSKSSKTASLFLFYYDSRPNRLNLSPIRAAFEGVWRFRYVVLSVSAISVA